MTRQPEKLPPQNIDAEQAVIGAMFIAPEMIPDVLAVIPRAQVHWFYRPDHRAIFEAVNRLHADGKPIDILHVEDELRRLNRLEDVGGQDYLLELATSAPTACNAPFYAGLVRTAGLRRDMIETAREIERRAYEDGEDVDAILADAEVAILKVGQERSTRNEPKRLADVVAAELAAIRKGENRIGMQTGIDFIDRKSGGIHRGQLIVVAGRPSLGKTALALNIFDRIADEGRTPCAFFSLEMSEADIARRLVAMRNDRPFVDLIRPDRLSEADREGMAEACKGRWRNVFIESGGGMALADVCARVRRLVQKHGVGLVVVDYLQLIRDERTARQTREAEVSAVSRGLKALALSLNIGVVALAQLNRAGEATNRLPRLSDLRESGAIEQDADAVLFLHRDGERDPRADVETLWLLLEKCRNGELGRDQVVFRKRSMTFHPMIEDRSTGRVLEYVNDGGGAPW